MRARIVRIGNSRGVRIPKPLLDKAGLPEEVEIRAGRGRIVIEAAAQPRAGWAEAARLLRERGEGGLIDEPAATRFDREDWEWK
jgi:antitoxin MazE